MTLSTEIVNLNSQLVSREQLLRINNATAKETSLLSSERFDYLTRVALIAMCIPNVAFLLAFQQNDDYDGLHFLWFKRRIQRFIYVDRVVVAEEYRRHGLGRTLYAKLFERAKELGHSTIVCEVNLQPPNLASDAFHAAHGFQEVGRATFNEGRKIVRYLCRQSDS